MNAYTLAARETVREQVEAIRELLAIEPSIEVLKEELQRACWGPLTEWRHPQDYEIIELWARLAADLAGMIQQRSECPDCGRTHGDHHNSCVHVKP